MPNYFSRIKEIKNDKAIGLHRKAVVYFLNKEATYLAAFFQGRQ
jgi:ABC-type antimicrobial peptide transport system permease subunit